MNPEPLTLNLLKELGNKIFSKFLLKADELMAGDRFKEAYDLLIYTSHFCKNTSEVQCTNNLDQKITLAKYGIYNSFLIIANKAIDSEKLKLAEEYIFKAQNYQNKNRSEIINSSKANTALNRLANRYLIRVKFAVMTNDQDSAKKVFQYIHNVYGKYYSDESSFSSSLPNKLLYNLVIEHNNDSLINYCAIYYLITDQPQQSLLYLQLLCSRQAPEASTIDIQTKLGAKLALADCRNSNGLNAEAKLFEYTKNKEWYVYFNEAYLKSWYNQNP